MKVKFINKLTSTEMYVDESRVKEYLEAGHALASPPPVKEAKKRTRKKVQK